MAPFRFAAVGFTSLLLVSILTHAARGQAPADQHEAVDEVGAYRGLGLPMPPPSAPLVQFEDGAAGDIRGSHLVYRLGFLLQPAAGRRRASVLVGIDTVAVDKKLFLVSFPDDFNVRDTSPDWEKRNTFATAIQCRARGWKKLADGLQDKSLHEFIGSGVHLDPSPYVPPKDALNQLAWEYWASKITEPEIDRTETANRLQMLLATAPEFNRPENIALVHSLKAALKPSTAKPGSMEALVDAHQDIVVPTFFFDPDPAYLKLAAHGFEAVPTLIAHLDDDRLTRSARLEFFGRPNYCYRVNDFVSDMLKEIAGDSLNEDLPNGRVSRAAATKWWDRARTQTEEVYFVSHVLEKGKPFPERVMLQVISQKYPADLPELFSICLEKRPEIALLPIIKAVDESQLPAATKTTLYLRVADDPIPEKRRSVYPYLCKVDKSAVVVRLVKDLDALPKSPAGSYWSAREPEYSALAIQTDDPRVLSALVAAARRADVWLRLQYLQVPCNSAFEGSEHRGWLNFLSAFLADSEVRQAPETDADPLNHDPYSGLYAGFLYHRIEVRDFAALQIAAILRLPGGPEFNDTPVHWATFRERVSTALKKELAD